MILSFSISCSNEDKTGGSDNGNTGGETSGGGGSNEGDSNSGGENGGSAETKHELEGTWVGYDTKDKNYELKFTVDSAGNITFYPKPYPFMISPGNTNLRNYLYTGKVKTNDIVYHYTNDVTCAYLNQIGDGYGKFVFSSPSNCTAKYDRIDAGNNAYKIITTNEENIVKTNNVGGHLGLSWVTVEFTKQ